MTEAQLLSCSRCGTTIGADELTAGLAVRVDGSLVCQMCVDTLPGEAVVRINQVRAMRGLEVTTYQVKLAQQPHLQLYSFTTSANVTGHRRKLVSDGFFEAPPLPPPAERGRSAPPPKVVTDRVVRGQLPERRPMLIAAGATVVILGGIALVLAIARPEKKPSAPAGGTSEVPTPTPVALKSRLDYPVEPLQAWTQASQDRDCPTLVRQGIAQELLRRRSQQLDNADLALAERRLDDASALANAMTVPDDIAFREIHRREDELRQRLLNSRTVATLTPPAPTLAAAPTSPAPVIASAPAPPAAAPAPAAPAPPPAAPPQPGEAIVAGPDGSLRLLAAAADIQGTGIVHGERGGSHALIDWKSGSDQARWRVRLAAAGSWRVELRTAAAAGDSTLQLMVGDQRLVLAVPATGSWTSFRTTTGGPLSAAAGDLVVQAGGLPGMPWHSLNLAEIRLVPADAAAPAPALKPAGVQVSAWKGAFVSGARDRAPKEVAIDGSENLPPGLPGGVTQLFRSSKSLLLKRHAAFLDLANADARDGGVVVLVHPGRNDRNVLVPSLTDSKGLTVKLPAVALPDGQWTTLVLPVSAADGLDTGHLLTLALEDEDKAAQIPDDGGFFLAKAACVSGRAATASDLGLRASALLPDPNRLRNLPRLLEVLAKNRKRPNAQKLFEPGRIRFLLGGWSQNQDWRLGLRKLVTAAAPANQPNPMMVELAYSDAWLDALTKGKPKEAILDPQVIHLAVIWSGGDELTAFPDPAQAVGGFWRRRLEQLIDAGILPVVVIGPNMQRPEHRAQTEVLWNQLIALPPVRLHGMPVIDLRALPTADDGGWDATTAALAAQLVADGINETIMALRRLGAVK